MKEKIKENIMAVITAVVIIVVFMGAIFLYMGYMLIKQKKNYTVELKAISI